ncbi:MAG: DUF424 family protein [Candidatus Pacearchaeota archaeon]|nr:DUF424 family protein [Candidatus Pacearchaeota archaeon]
MKIKIHKTYRTVVAICDSDILGKCFEEGIELLDIRENFYNGEEIEEDRLVEQMIDLAKEDATFNIAGSSSVQAALKAGIIDKEGIKTIQGVPFALVLI